MQNITLVTGTIKLEQLILSIEIFTGIVSIMIILSLLFFLIGINKGEVTN